MRNRKRLWFVVGFGTLVVTAVGAYYYLHTHKTRSNKKVKMVEAMIREAEKIIRSHRD